MVETPIRRRQTPLAGPRAPLLPAASLHCRRPGQLGVWKPALPPLAEANCFALPAAVEVPAIGETPSPSRRGDSKARAPTRRPGPGGPRPLSHPLRRFRHSGHSTAPAGCGHARVRVMMFSQAGRLPVPASCGAAPVGSLSSISLGAASDFARWNLSNVTHANSTGPRAIFIQSPGACKFAPCPAAIGRAALTRRPASAFGKKKRPARLLPVTADSALSRRSAASLPSPLEKRVDRRPRTASAV